MTPERWRQIERLYHAALELEGSGRAAFLKGACGADNDLRREVESLLASDGHSAYVYQNDITRAAVFRLDLATGKRQFLTELAPSDPAGLTDVTPVRITPDGKFYAYSYNRALSTLFLARGVK